MPTIHISSEVEYNRYISQNKLTVADFYSDTCGPCKAIAPRFEQLSNTYRNANFLKVNVNEMNSLASGLSIRAIPTFVFYTSGKLLHQMTGANPSELESNIKKYYKKEGMPTTGGHVLGGGKPGTSASATTAANNGGIGGFLSDPPQAFLYGILIVLLIYWFTKGKATDADYARWLKN